MPEQPADGLGLVAQHTSREEANNSIYCVQAAETQCSPEAAHLIPQYDGLRCWSEVDLKVLRSINWLASRAYGDTLFP